MKENYVTASNLNSKEKVFLSEELTIENERIPEYWGEIAYGHMGHKSDIITSDGKKWIAVIWCNEDHQALGVDTYCISGKDSELVYIDYIPPIKKRIDRTAIFKALDQLEKKFKTKKEKNGNN